MKLCPPKGEEALERTRDGKDTVEMVSLFPVRAEADRPVRVMGLILCSLAVEIVLTALGVGGWMTMPPQ
jgi:hypothetical protein